MIRMGEIAANYISASSDRYNFLAPALTDNTSRAYKQTNELSPETRCKHLHQKLACHIAQGPILKHLANETELRIIYLQAIVVCQRVFACQAVNHNDRKPM